MMSAERCDRQAQERSGGAVKIAFAGKGGSGKTTLSSIFVRHLAAQGLPVVAIDANINQHLAEALGASRRRSAGT
jgi:CO dehydrogenase maturation factor